MVKSADSVVPESSFIPKELFDRIQKVIPIVCVDLVILRRTVTGIEVLLIRRKLVTEVGKWCNIGGRLLKGERLTAAINRQAKRELGISVVVIPPWGANNPVRVFDDPEADPQKHSVAMVYPVTIIAGRPADSGPEFSESKWFLAKKLPKTMGFNHREEVQAVTGIIS